MRPSSDRGQFEAVVALVAVLAIGAGLTVYAGTLSGVVPDEPERETAETALDRVHGELRVAGVVDPTRLGRTGNATPGGWQANVTVRTRNRIWQHGPDPPEGASRADRRVSVRVAPGDVDPARLTVVLWR
ncbi:MAG: hypothetical protein BRD23_08555 [Halobacteriales archaeon SW_9_67_25]|jgi:hypothetical protein|nr:MAG: hypothetical protein BRD23_08555 [Halobacteriales archaeon SW_9_67_25]